MKTEELASWRRRSWAVRPVQRLAGAALILACAGGALVAGAPAPVRLAPAELAADVIRATRPLAFPRGDRLPIILWPLQGLEAGRDEALTDCLRQLDARGLSPVTSWKQGTREASRAAALRMAALQRALGLRVVVNASDVMQPFFNGDESTAHVDAEGHPFFNAPLVPKIRSGCPFALDDRVPVIRAQVSYFVQGYRARELPLDVVLGDWEVDGPLEWGDAHAAAQRCVRCRQHIEHIERFADFQAAVRRVRAGLQKSALSDVVRQAFPAALVGNYGVYPNDGFRYWYDYFEPEVTVPPYVADGRARYRPWYQEFPLTGYTVAMPVVYTWYRTFQWYDYAEPDFRWVYNLLLVGSNAARRTPATVPLLPFVHWHTTAPPAEPDPNVKPLTAGKYQELLWHLLLRGHDGLAVWSPRPELAEEARLVQEVYAAALEYREFLDRGEPVSFAVPRSPGPVVSGLKLGSRVLVRRTDFDSSRESVRLTIAGHSLRVPRAEGRCQVLTLDQ